MMTMTREQIEAVLDGSLAGTKLAYSDSGYGVIYIAPVENEDTAVAVPVRDKNMGWHKANPEVYMALVDRFNAAPDLARTALSLMDRLADAETAQAALVERAIYPCSYDVPDNLTYDEAQMFRAGAEAAIDAVAASIRRLAPDAGMQDLEALRAERDRFCVDWGNQCRHSGNLQDKLDAGEADRDRLAARVAELEAREKRLLGLVEIAGRARLIIDTAFLEMGETVNYAPSVIAEVCDMLDPHSALSDATEGGEG